MSSKVKKTLKILLITLGLYLIFVVAMYNYGPWPGGKIAQKRDFRLLGRYLLSSYYSEQKDSLRYRHLYRDDLLGRQPYSTQTFFKLGFAADNSDIAKYCSDCVKTANSFKIGALGRFKGEDEFWTIDDQGNLSNPKSLK